MTSSQTQNDTRPGTEAETPAGVGARAKAGTGADTRPATEPRAGRQSGAEPQPGSVAESVTEPGSEPGSPDALIAGHRERIDHLDARIISLVQERMGVSAQIQRARVESGGRRVNLSREMEILNRYSDSLGKPGTALAMTLLELCRGRA